MGIKFVKKPLAGDEGSVAIEYALIAALIAVVLVGALVSISGIIDDTFTTITSNIANVRNDG